MADDNLPQQTIKCSWDGCGAKTELPATDGWVALANWGPSIKDGVYCPAHVAVLEAVLVEQSENDL